MEKSINQLMKVNKNAMELTSFRSYLVNEVERLCDLPISDLEVENYRTLIAQEVALEFTVPLALDILEKDLFVEGEYYEGDLLKSILTINKKFWEVHPVLKEKLRKLWVSDSDRIETLELTDEIKTSLRTAASEFLK